MTKPGTYKRKPDLPEGYVFGRPTLYKKEYCELLLEHMKNGSSFWSFGAIVHVTLDTLSEWCKKFPDFAEAKRIGKMYELKWWDDLHRRNAATGEGNATLIVWAQKNKFPALYKERMENKINQNIKLTGDFKQLVANMDATQLHDLISAVATQTALLEAKHDTTQNSTGENIGNNTLREKPQKTPKGSN